MLLSKRDALTLVIGFIYTIVFLHMNLEPYYERTELELTRAAQALTVENDGMARACSRRAVGAMVEAWMTIEPDPRYGGHTMSALRGLVADERSPEKVQHAANRLLHGIRDKDSEDFPNAPIEDAKTIIEYVQKRIWVITSTTPLG